ncbi:hypothetical protein [Mycobacterium sp. HNNTM2301]|uniref:hypothetical protein n=1 Tax=Mycobacterium hainanense TaxID=3289775 RepID=UPI0035A70165
MAELDSQVMHLPGGSLIAPEMVAELCGVIAFVDAELANRSRLVSVRLRQLHAALAPGRRRRVGATDATFRALSSIQFGSAEIDSTTAAGMLEMKPDTLRKKLRLGLIEGRRDASGRWWMPLSAVEELLQQKAA